MNDFTLNLRKKSAQHKTTFRCLIIFFAILISGFWLWNVYEYALKPLYQIYIEQEDLIYIHDADTLTPARIALYSESITNKNNQILI